MGGNVYMSYIQIQNLHKSFGNNEVLKELNLSIERGQLVTLLGPSGCGKSTLLRCLAGLETVTSGNIILDGEDITHKNPKDRKIGMVFQQYSLFPNLNVYDNIAFGLKIKKIPKTEIEKHVISNKLGGKFRFRRCVKLSWLTSLLNLSFMEQVNYIAHNHCFILIMGNKYGCDTECTINFADTRLQFFTEFGVNRTQRFIQK